MLTSSDLHNLLPEFIDYLTNTNSSRSTIKNYASDLRRVLEKLPAQAQIDDAQISTALENLRAEFSESTIRRFSFSLKAFTGWLTSKGYELKAVVTPVNISEPIKENPIQSYVTHIQAQGAAPSTTRQYAVDLNSFFSWLKPKKDFNKKTVARVSRFDINRYTSFLKSRGSSPSTINRYLYSLRGFFNFHKEQVVYDSNPVKVMSPTSGEKNSFWQKLNFRKPRWWHAYRGHPVSDYINWTVLAVLTLLVGLSVYSKYYAPKPIDLAALKNGLVLGSAAPPRILSFQGRLTNNSATPIVAATNVVFKIYDDRTLGGGHLKWTSKTWSVTPDQNGIFSVCLGGQDTTDDCLLDGIADTVIPANLFTDNASLYLGITVGSDSEASPRQRIASSTYALNAGAVNSSFSSATDNDYGNSISFTNASTSTTKTVNGIVITPNGTSTSGTNNLISVNFASPATPNSNNFYALNFATGYTDILQYNGTQLIDGTGHFNIGSTSTVSGTLPIANGGTNSNSSIGGAGAVVYSDGTKYAYSGTTGSSSQCLLSGASGTGQPTWGACGGSVAFGSVTAGTNTAALVIGTGGSLTTSGSGTITATDVVCTTCIALNTETSGNYVASTNTSVLTGLTGGSAGSAAAALTLALDYSQALSGDVGLAANAAVFGQSGLVFEGSSADTIETYIAITNPTGSDHVFTFPDVATGDICISGIACTATSFSEADTLQTVTARGASSDQAISLTKVNAASGSADVLTLSGTLGIFNGSDTFRGLYLNYTNANHTGSTNVVNAIDIAQIVGDVDATETAINLGAGWQNILKSSGSSFTQVEALTAINLDFSTGYTVPNSSLGNQTGISLTLKDGGASATATGISISGSLDKGIAIAGSATGISLSDITTAGLTIATTTGLTITNGVIISPSGGGNVTTGYSYKIGGAVSDSATGTNGYLIDLDCALCGSGVTTLTNGFHLSAAQSSSTTTVTNGILIDGAGTITNGINFATTSIGTDIILQNGETIDNNTDGFIKLTGNATVGTLASIFTGGQSTLQVLGNVNNGGATCTIYSLGGCSGIFSSPVVNVNSSATDVSAFGLYARVKVDDSTGGAITLYNAVGINIDQHLKGTADIITNAYGLTIQNMTAGGTNNIALCFDCLDGTFSGTTASAGISWGVDANAVTLYRSANDTLKTDDNLNIALHAAIGGGAISTLNAITAAETITVSGTNSNYISAIPVFSVTGATTAVNTYLGQGDINVSTGITLTSARSFNAPIRLIAAHAGTLTNMVSYEASIQSVNGSTGTWTNAYGFYLSSSPANIAGLGPTNMYGLRIGANTGATQFGGAASSGTNYGIEINDVVVPSGGTAYGICFDCDGTYTTSGSQNGITWGTDNPAQIYRAASNAITIATSSNGDINLSTNGTGDVKLSQGAGSQLSLSASAATTVDQIVITNTGQGSVTDGVDAISASIFTATGGGVTNSAFHAIIGNAPVDSSDIINGLNVDGIAQTVSSTTQNLALLSPATSGNTAGTLNGLKIGSITTANTAQENAIYIGNSWDASVAIAASGANAVKNFTIKNDASTQINLLEVRDLTGNANNFGSLALADAFISRQSYWGEEFSVIKSAAGTGCSDASITTAVTTTFQRRGDQFPGPLTSGGAAITQCSAGSGELLTSSSSSGTNLGQKCDYRSSSTFLNGAEQIVATGVSNRSATCLETTSSTTAQQTLFNTQNFPEIVMKVMPSAVGSSSQAVYAGLSTRGAVVDGGLAAGNIGFYFSNCTNPIAGALACTTAGWQGFVADGTTSPPTKVSCAATTISTSVYSYLRIEVRKATTAATAVEVEFFVDYDTTNGIAETSCGTVTTTGTAFGAASNAMGLLLQSYTANATVETLNVDYVRVWQDDAAPGVEPQNDQLTNVPDGGIPADTIVENNLIDSSLQPGQTPTAPSANLKLDPENNLVASVSAGTKFIWNDSAGKAVGWVSDIGEAVFSKITSLVGDFGKLVFGEAVVKKDTKTAGQANFDQGATEVTIDSPKVHDDSLINLTPVSKTGGFHLYIKEIKARESFTVGLERSAGDQPNEATASATQAIKFSWFILNQE